MTWEGGCLCGAVRYEILNAPEFVEYCHCRTCRKAVGAPVVTWALVAREDFKLSQGILKAYASSDGVERTFCPRCGTSMTYYAVNDPQRLVVSTATLDDMDALPPDVHVWRSERVAWFETADHLPRYLRFKFEGIQEA